MKSVSAKIAYEPFSAQIKKIPDTALPNLTLRYSNGMFSFGR